MSGRSAIWIARIIAIVYTCLIAAGCVGGSYATSGPSGGTIQGILHVEFVDGTDCVWVEGSGKTRTFPEFTPALAADGQARAILDASGDTIAVDGDLIWMSGTFLRIEGSVCGEGQVMHVDQIGRARR